MENRTIAGFIVFVSLAVVSAAARPGAAADASRAPSLHVTVSVVMDQGLSPASLEQALALSTSIYREAGVDLHWVWGDRAETALLTLVLTAAPVKAGLSGDAMGVAPAAAADGSRGTTVYVFHDKASQFAHAHRIPLWAVLGCAVAHEIGHALLPAHAHAESGIMRASWQPSHFPPRSAGVPGFLPEQSKLLQARVASRGAARKAGELSLQR